MMASSGGWLPISFMLIIFVMSFRTSSSLRCERGLGNCVDDELAISRHLKKRAQSQCRFGCFGRKRETVEKKPLKNPENEKQTVDELIDEILQKKVPSKRDEVQSSRPPCQRFNCPGKKRSVEPPKNEFSSEKEVISKRKPSGLAGCWKFGSCKRTAQKVTFSSPEKLESSEMEHQEEEKQQQDSKPDCFRFGCKKRELTGEEETGLPFAPNEETQEVIPPVDEDDTQKPRCWRFGCGKRSTYLQMLVEKIAKRFNEKANELEQFGQEKQKKPVNPMNTDK